VSSSSVHRRIYRITDSSRANEITSSPRSDRRTAEAAGALPQASYHSFVENLDHRGRQYPHGNSRGHTMGARIDVHLQAHIAVLIPPGHNPHRGMPPISLNLATDPRTLALEPQTALSIGDRTPIVESPRSYHDGTDVRSPATESTASDLSELGWPFRPS
jgi:hypothetical protein